MTEQTGQPPSKPHIRLHVSRVMHSGGTRHVDFWRVQVFRHRGGPLMHIGHTYSTARAAAAEAALATQCPRLPSPTFLFEIERLGIVPALYRASS